MPDLDSSPQHRIRVKVKLTDKRDFEILYKTMEIDTDPPRGNRVQFLGISIALRHEHSDYVGIVPDFRDVIRSMVTSDQEEVNSDTALQDNDE